MSPDGLSPESLEGDGSLTLFHHEDLSRSRKGGTFTGVPAMKAFPHRRVEPFTEQGGDLGMVSREGSSSGTVTDGLCLPTGLKSS